MITDLIKEKSELVKAAFDRSGLVSGKSMFINIWEDGDFKVEIRAAIERDIHHFTYHHSKSDAVIYYCEKNALIQIQDEHGELHWIETDIYDEAFDTDSREVL